MAASWKCLWVCMYVCFYVCESMFVSISVCVYLCVFVLQLCLPGGAILVSPPRVRASMRERPPPSPQGKPRSPQRLLGYLSPARAPFKVGSCSPTLHSSAPSVRMCLQWPQISQWRWAGFKSSAGHSLFTPHSSFLTIDLYMWYLSICDRYLYVIPIYMWYLSICDPCPYLYLWIYHLQWLKL